MELLDFFLEHSHYTYEDHQNMAWFFMNLRSAAKEARDYAQESYYWQTAMTHHNMALTLAPRSGISINEEF